jgi:hypothetical protein
MAAARLVVRAGMDIDLGPSRMGGSAQLGRRSGRCRADGDYHSLRGQFRLSLPVVAVILQPPAAGLGAIRGGVPMGVGAGLVRRPAAVFSARQLVDRAVFCLGQLCGDFEPVYRAAEWTFWANLGISSLPNRLYIRDDLVTRNNSIRHLPPLFFVGGELDIPDTEIALVPQSNQIVGRVITNTGALASAIKWLSKSEASEIAH